MIYLRQSTASQEVPLGHFVDDADGKTAETGLTIANTDIKVWKTGATTLANKNSGGATHISGGIYYCVLDATDTDTVGPLVLFVAVSGALAVRLECVVLEEAMYDWQFGTAVPLSPATAGRTLVVDAAGLADANVVKLGPSGSGTAQTAKDVGGAVPAAAAGASGGLLISGSNSGTTTLAALTVSGATTLTGNVSMAAGLNITQSSANTPALVVTGTGTGSGAVFTGGAAVTTTAGGHGVSLVGGASSTGAGGTAGLGLLATGGAGSASTNGAAIGVKFVGGGTNTVASAAHGLAVTGASTGDGLSATSGGGATGNGITATAASTNGSGMAHVSTGTGSGVLTDKFTASGAVAFQSTFAVTTSTSLGAFSCTTLTASGAVAFQSTFAVTTSTALAALSCTTLTASGAVAFQSTFAVTTSTALAALSCSTLTASGAVAFQSTFATTGTTTFNALTVTNATTLSGAVSLGSTLGVTGTSTFAAVTTTGTLTVNAFTCSNVFTVSGATTLTGAVTASNASNNVVGIDVAKISGDATAADNAELFFDGTGYNAANSTVGTVTLVTTLTTYTGNTVQTGDSYAIVNSGTHGNAAIKGYVDDIGTAGAGLTAVPWNAAWDAEVQSEVQDAIEANHLDHLIAVADPGSIVANSSLWAALVSKSATPAYSSYVNTTDSLEAQRDNVGTAGAGLTAADDAVITAVAALNNLSAAQVNAEVDTALADVGLTTTITGRIDAAISTRLIGSTTGSGLSAIPWNAAWDAEVQSEVDDALVAQRLDELLNADSDVDGAQPPTVGSVFHELMTKTTGSFTFDQTTDSLEALRDRGDAAWITATGFSTHTAADVWAVATRLLTAGTNIALAKGTGVTGFTDLSAADVRTAVGLASANLDTQLSTIDDFLDSEIAAIKTVTDNLATAIELDGSVYRFTTNALEQAPSGGGSLTAQQVWEYATRVLTAGTNLSIPTAAANAAAVWDLATSGHTTSGTFGAAMAAAGSAGDPWSTSQPGAYASGTFGYLVAHSIADAAAAVLAAGTTIVVGGDSPADGGTTTIIQGDGYYSADGRARSWNSTISLNLGTATVALKVKSTPSQDSTIVLSVTAAVTGSAGSWIITVELTELQTAALNLGLHAIELIATLTGGHVLTLLQGFLDVTS